MIDQKLKYRRWRVDFENLIGRPLTDQEFDNIAETFGIMTEQSRTMGFRYGKASAINPAYADTLFNLWTTKQDDTDNLLRAMQSIIDVGPGPGPGPGPSPGVWQPPTKKGMNEVVPKTPGGFYMSGMRIKEGLLLGTYRKDGLARIRRFDGTLHEELSLPTESVYMFYATPDGLPIFTTECPAQVFKQFATGKWGLRFTRPEGKSVAFEIHKVKDGLAVFTVNPAWGTNVRMIKGDVNGNAWLNWKDFNGRRLLNCCSDGEKEYLYGDEEGFPVLVNFDGSRKLWMKDYPNNTINYAVVDASGNFTLGMNSITEPTTEGKKRNAYIVHYDGVHPKWIVDLTRPWLMDIQIDPVNPKIRYGVSSVWDEDYFKTCQLHISRDGGKSWETKDIPMPACIAMQVVPGEGVYLFGGKYNEYAQAFLYKF